MKARYLAGALAVALAAPAAAQTASTTTNPQITLYELPGYLGRSVTVTAATADLAAQQFAARAQSARVTGEWQICSGKGYSGNCRTVTSNQPFLARSTAVSVRPAGASATAGTAETTAAATAAGTALNLDALDAGGGTEGQDVTFFATPTLSGTQIAAGTNDLATATAFCKLAGAQSALSAGRTRVQSSGLIDLSARARDVRAFALRDVVCRK